MVAGQRTINKFGSTLGVQAKKKIIPNVVTGVGADQTMRAVDNIFGSPVQRVFSVQIPFLGNVGPIDLINYLIHSRGFKISQQGLTAVIGAKAVGGTLPALAGTLPIPGLGQVANPNVTPSGPGAPL